MSAQTVSTPLYVLLDGKLRIGPSLSATHSGPDCTAIYCFSDKHHYDLFLDHHNGALTPYPLVKGYLKSQIADADELVQLVVVDAAGPDEAQLDAATMEAVLQAMDRQTSHVPVSHRLTLVEQSGAYHVEKVSGGFVVATVPT